MTSPISHVVEQQPRVLEITSTLPKGLGKKDNIKASLRQHPWGAEVGVGAQLLTSAADSRESGGGMKSPLIPLSPNLREEPESGGYSRSGRRGLREKMGSGRDVDKREAATLNKRTVTQGEEAEENRTETATGNKPRKRKQNP